MPNYSQNTKLTLAAVDEPPYLTVGTDVSAKYKGAFCEAKIIDVNKHVKLRVLFDGHPGSYMIDDSELKQGSLLEIGSKIEARHPEKKQQIYTHATITKILDQSRYTVVFDDGDQCILRRNSICLKSGKHFAESETLDQLPLTNPEHFGNPVKVGQTSLEQNNHNNSTNHSHQQVGNQPTDKLSNSISNNANNNGGNTVSSKNGLADFNSQTCSTTCSNAKGQNNVKIETEKPNRGKSNASTSGSVNNTSTTTPSSSGPPGRRGGGKGRKRRESTTSNAKQSSEIDEEPDNDSQDSADVVAGDSDINFGSIEIGVKLMVQYGKGKIQNVYEAKVNKIETNSSGKIRYLVHYTGWNNRYDEWITKNRILSVVTERENCAKDGRSKQNEHNSSSATSSSSSVVSSDPNINKEIVTCKDKDKEKDCKPLAKTPRRSRQADVTLTNASVTVSDEPNSSSVASSAASSTVVVTETKVAPTPPREKDRDREREKDALPKTRRSRLPATDNTNTSAPTFSPISTTSESKTIVRLENDVKEEVKAKEETKERSKDKEPTSTPSAKQGKPKNFETIPSSPNPEKAQALPSIKSKEKEPLTKTRRSRHADSGNSLNQTSPRPPASTTQPRSEAQQNEREKTKEREKEAHLTSKEIRSAKQTELLPQLSQRSASNSLPSKDRESERDQNNVSTTKTRGSKQAEARSTICSSSLTSTTVSSSSASSLCSISTATTTPTNQAATTSSTGTAPPPAVILDNETVSVSNNPSKDRERDREKERERDREKDRERDKEPPIKIRRSRQITSDSSGIALGKDTSATNTTVNSATTTTSCTSAASSTTSTAPSSLSPSNSMPLMNTHLSAPASLSEKDREKFDDLPMIDEPDCDKRISILQDKIMTIRQTYMALKAELADLDRRRKRPRMERSNSDHINLNSGVACRN